jgi:protein MpaA
MILYKTALRVAPLFILTCVALLPLTSAVQAESATYLPKSTIKSLCSEIGNKLGSVNEENCLSQHLVHDNHYSNEGRPLAYKVYPPLLTRKPLGKVLLMGGIHGDEYSAISVMFKWMDTLNIHHSGLFHWTVIPSLNPDGLLQRKAQRQNANGVDLNRNFPSKDWNELALKYWKEKTYKNPRRFPGNKALSEPETIWLDKVIKAFQPDVIIALHAPHRLVDFDGSLQAPKKLGGLHLRLLGTYPGSLGNYAGVDLNIPVVTVELASAGSMPSNNEISRMWVDMIRWLQKELPKKS